MTSASNDLRAAIVRTSRTWLGTPYHHQASAKGIGTDCLGLVRGVWREIYGSDAETPPAYSRDWAEVSGIETLIAAAGRHMVCVDVTAAEAGDVVIFRMQRGAVAKHAGVLTSNETFLHAMEGVPVSEVALTNWWRRRLVAAFRFPELHAPSP